MKMHPSGTKTGFVCRSLLWSLLLYGCFISVSHWNTISGLFSQKEEKVVVHTNTNSSITSVKISIDSMQKGIRIADGILRQLKLYIVQ